MVPPKPSKSHPQATTARSSDPGMVCVSVRRGGHFWRFACDGAGVRELFERLAALADSDAPLSWEDAEVIAAQVLSNQSPDRGQPASEYDR